MTLIANVPPVTDSSSAFDVVIAGGGMVGASLALALARLPLRIAIVESVEPVMNGFQPSYDMRSTALSWGTRRIYEALGVWAQMELQATPIRRIHVSDKGRPGVVQMEAAEQKLPAMGYVLPNAWMGAVLWGQMKQQPSISVLSPAKVVGAMRTRGSEHQVQVERAGQGVQTLTARLLVVADGGRSALCQALHLPVDETPYAQSAIIANGSFSRPHQCEAFERFTDTGPLAVLPLGGEASSQDCAMVWTVPAASADALMSLDDSAFMARIQERFGYRLGRIRQVGIRAQYPLSLLRAREQIRPGLVVVGNAAHTLHPVAGQGYNLALRGVMRLAETAAQALPRDLPLGSLEVLQAFADRQRQDQEKTIFFSDRVTRLFSNSDRRLSFLRDCGLIGMEMLPFLKHRFACQAMGLGASATAGHLYSVAEEL